MRAPALFLQIGGVVGTASKALCGLLLKVVHVVPDVVVQYAISY